MGGLSLARKLSLDSGPSDFDFQSYLVLLSQSHLATPHSRRLEYGIAPIFTE